MNGQIFNIYQANIFIQKGATVKGCALSKGKVYIEFETNEMFYELLRKWNSKK